MTFRFSPRQLGLFGRAKKGRSGGGELYEQKDGVTEAEVSRMEHSRLTPYRHKPSAAGSANEGEANTPPSYDEFLADYSSQSGLDDALVRDGLDEVIIDVDSRAPHAYTYEAQPGGSTAPPSAREAAPARHSLGVDKKGEPATEEDVIAMITSELERRRRERLPLELQWQLNSNFYDGNQFCDINPYANEVRQLPIPKGRDGKSREVFNRISPLIETRIANLKKINYRMRVRPATNELDDVKKAKVSSAVLQNAQSVSGFNAKKDALILWNELCGSCFWLTWWDASKGAESVRFSERTVGEDGIPVLRERVIHEGDVDYGLLTPYEVFPESLYRQTVAEQGSIIVEQVRTVDEIKNLYGIEVEGTEVDTFTLTPVPGAAGGFGYEAAVITLGKAKMPNCQRVITYFERPTETFPDGRMAVLVGESDLVYYGVLPLGEIPIVRTVCKERAGQFFGKSVIEELIPLQRDYNAACNDIADFLRRSKSFQWLTYQGQIDVDTFAENAGRDDAILSWMNNTALPPQRMSPLTFSAEVFTQKRDLESQMEYVAAVSQLMVYGQLPTGVSSGTAIESLRDIDNTRLALTGDNIRASVVELAKLWLKLYKEHSTFNRVIRYTGVNDIGAAIVWNSSDITCFDVDFTTENELLYSETNQWQRLISLLTSGIPDQNLLAEASDMAREFIKNGAANSEMSINELQTQAAARENTLLGAGVVPQINEYDNHVLHADEHLRYILQAEFISIRAEKPNLAEALVEHWKAHVAAIGAAQRGGV